MAGLQFRIRETNLEKMDPKKTENLNSQANVDRVEDNAYRGIDTAGIPNASNPVYEKKIAIMNQALIDIGMGSFQWKIYAMTGFGWFVDNFWMQAITIISAPVRNEFKVERIAFLTVAKYAGLVIGLSAWPVTADYIGRRLAFNITLLNAATAGLVGAGSPSFVAIATFCAFIGMGTGGNQPVDSAIFLEFIPATHQYILSGAAECGYHDNLGWRYTLWIFRGLTLVMFLLRLTFRVYETPKFLLGKGKDAEAVEVVEKIAARNKGTTWLTLAHFEAIDHEFGAEPINNTETTPNANNGSLIRQNLSKFKPEKVASLFSTPRAAVSTTLMIFLWCSIGMAYLLYNSFIPIYLENKGVSQGQSSLEKTYRNYAIQAVCGIPASLLGGLTVNMRRVGRKGTGALACIGIGVFLFLFTRAKNEAGTIGFSCAIAFFQNLL
ncbi:MFS siderochrome iron transporter [Paramyrothecium foliicola]|nr:MFS siderochrome iron transporter [Paramyrothecium foliicola]